MEGKRSRKLYLDRAFLCLSFAVISIFLGTGQGGRHSESHNEPKDSRRKRTVCIATA